MTAALLLHLGFKDLYFHNRGAITVSTPLLWVVWFREAKVLHHGSMWVPPPGTHVGCGVRHTPWQNC